MPFVPSLESGPLVTPTRLPAPGSRLSPALGVTGSGLTGGLVTRSSRIEGSLEKRLAAGGTVLGVNWGAGVGPGVEGGTCVGTPVGAGGSKMRTRSGVSE